MYFASKKDMFLQRDGPNGELGASLRYLSRRYVMPYLELKAILTDIGAKELRHFEMVGTIAYQLTRNLTSEQIKEAGSDPYFVDHTTGIYPVDASGVPYSASTFASKGDPTTDLYEDLVAKQKTCTTYDNILRFCDDLGVIDPIRFLRQREVVYYQCSGEGLRITTDHPGSEDPYALNPSFDKK